MSVTEVAPGRHVVDFGQNSNGWVRLADLGPAGTRSPSPTASGSTPTATSPRTTSSRSFASTDASARCRSRPTWSTSAGDGGTCSSPATAPRASSTSASRATPGRSTPTTITSVVVHTDLDRIGGFECSDERDQPRCTASPSGASADNACDIPTDCPTRERSGWTGDWQIYVETAAFLYDVGGFSAKWLRDLAAEQRARRRGHQHRPRVPPRRRRPPILAATSRLGRMGRRRGPRAVGAVPRHRRRTDVLDRAVRLACSAGSTSPPTAAATRPAPVARRARRRARSRTSATSGTAVGTSASGSKPATTSRARSPPLIVADHGPVATAYLHRSAGELAAHRRRPRRRRRRRAATASSPPTSPTRGAPSSSRDDGTHHARHPGEPRARPRRSGSSPTTSAPRRAADSSSSIRAAGTHLGTGFLATPFLLPVLADTGHLDVAYELLFQDTEPSWLVMVDRGATTVWEEWGGVDADGVPHASLNHYSKGAVISFLHQYVAGLQCIEPGYRRFRVAPRPGGGLAWATAAHDSPYGRIEVRWQQQGDGLTVDVTVPPGTTAEVLLPTGESTTFASGRFTVS